MMKVGTYPIVIRADLRRWRALDRAQICSRLPSFSSKAMPIQVGEDGLVRAPYFDRIENIISRTCKTDIDRELVRAAFSYAWVGHGGQKRKSGEPYLEHPLTVAEIVSEWGLGAEEVAAALCHDLIEDGEIGYQKVTRENIGEKLGSRIAELVDGMTELGKEPGFKGTKPSDVEITNKLLISGSKDLGSIIDKLADRLHNMRTLKWAKNQKEKAESTLYVYRRIADALGMWELKREYEDLSFQWLNPELYRKIEEKRQQIVEESRQRIEDIAKSIKNKYGTDPHEAILEIRGIYEICERMDSRKISLDQLSPSDVWRINFVVPRRQDCYRMLSIVHEYTHDPKEFEDNISNERPNGHQFLQTYVAIPGRSLDKPSLRLLVQIRDKKMQENYRIGVLSNGGETEAVWLDILLRYIKGEKGLATSALYDKLAEVSAHMITVTTLTGKQLRFPYGSTVLDFARRINRKVFLFAATALVNGQPVDFFCELENGNSVFIEIDKERRSWPTLEWREWIRGADALKTLRRALLFKMVNGKVIRKTGREIFDSARKYFEEKLRKHYLHLHAIRLLETELFKEFLMGKGIKSGEDFLDKIGRGEIDVSDLLKKFMEGYHEEIKKQINGRRLLRLKVTAEDRVGLLGSISALLGSEDINLNLDTVHTRRYREGELNMAEIVFNVEVVEGKASVIQALQIDNIIMTTDGVRNVATLSSEEVISFIFQCMEEERLK